jgi:hypothetical protein
MTGHNGLAPGISRQTAPPALDRCDFEPTRPGAETPGEARHPEELIAQEHSRFVNILDL